MSEPIDDPDHINNFGGPAFPVLDSNLDDGRCGMSLRDWFAGMAMQGIIAASGDRDGIVKYDERAVAQSAYTMADAMLEARRDGH